MWRAVWIMIAGLVSACAGIVGSDKDPELKLPSLSVGVQAEFANYLKHPAPLAFAIADDGGVSTAWVCRDGAKCTADEVVYARRAEESCERQSHGRNCLTYAMGRKVLWPDDHARDKTPRYRLVSPRSAQNPGPGTAKGVVIYLPGYGGGRFPRKVDYSLIAGHMLALNKRGWDLYRLNFEFYDYGPKTLDLVDKVVLKTVRDMRARGYRRVLLSGQSRGAWNLLRLARKDKVADGFFIDVPAAHGRSHSWNGAVNRNADNAIPDFRRLIAAQGANPLLFSFFAGDPFYGGDKVGVIRELMPARLGEDVFIIDHPAEVTGHGGAGRRAFIQGFADCLAEFAASGRVTAPGCRRAVDYSDPQNITTSAHARALGWRNMPQDKLAKFVPGLAVFSRARNRNWAGTYFGADQKTLSWVAGEYVEGNTVSAEWQVTDGKLCFVGSRRHHSNNYCYQVMRSEAEPNRVVLVSPYDEAYRLTFRHYASRDKFDFQPGAWQRAPLVN